LLLLMLLWLLLLVVVVVLLYAHLSTLIIYTARLLIEQAMHSLRRTHNYILITSKPIYIQYNNSSVIVYGFAGVTVFECTTCVWVHADVLLYLLHI
jgi:hypothetical protein